MTYLSLSRAARLAGVTRAELQARIRRGEIATFEGSVAINDLLRLYPSVSLTDDAALERAERIKRDALPKQHEVGETTLPDPRVLLSRLRGLSTTLAERVSHLDSINALLDEIETRLQALSQQPGQHLPDALSKTLEWIRAERGHIDASTASDQHAQFFAKDTFLRIMAANVKLIPSGHDFFVEGNESILDASIRAGLKVSYGCASGNCGDCKARVVSGETWKIRDHDYVISEREKAMGYILTCSQTAVTDLVLEAAEALRAEDLPHQEIRASLRKVEPLGPDLASIMVQTPRTQTLRFMAGQRVVLTLEGGETRELPIASCPCNGRHLWLYVRCGDDPFSHAVRAGLRPGQLITVSGPLGQFVLQEDAPEPAVFIAYDDGIAPIKSLVEHAVSIDLIESFHLYWDTRHPEGHHQAHWGRALRDALDNFSFTPLISGRPEDLITVLRADLPELEGLRFYVAGPAAAVQDTLSRLTALGVSPERIKAESTDTAPPTTPVPASDLLKR